MKKKIKYVHMRLDKDYIKSVLQNTYIYIYICIQTIHALVIFNKEGYILL